MNSIIGNIKLSIKLSTSTYIFLISSGLLLSLKIKNFWSRYACKRKLFFFLQKCLLVSFLRKLKKGK